MPESQYLTLPDNTLICEAAYSTFRTREVVHALSRLVNDRSKLSAVVHSLPESIANNTTEFNQAVCSLREVAGKVYLTDLDVNYYAAFGDSWDEFVQAMALKTIS